jgi:hypothetical protein
LEQLEERVTPASFILLLSGALQTNSLSADVVGGNMTVVGNASGTLTNAAVSFNGGANVNLTLDACSLTGTFGLFNDSLTIRNRVTFNATLQMSGSHVEFAGTQTLGGLGGGLRVRASLIFIPLA